MDSSKYMFCPHCGTRVLKTAKFCPHCGNQLHASSNSNVYSTSSSNQTAYQQSQRPVQNDPHSQNQNVSQPGMTKEFAASALLFWIKGYISENDNGIDIKIPNTVFLGLIPAGSETRHFTLKSITSPGVNTQYNIKDFIIGALVALFGLATIAAGIGILILLVGIGIFCNGIITDFTLEDNAGPLVIPVPFYNRSDIEQITDDIRQRIENVQNTRDQSRNLGNYFPQRH